MILSELIGYRSKINKLSADEFEDLADKALSKIIGDVTSDDPGLYHEQEDLIDLKKRILRNVDELKDQLSLYQRRLDDLVNERQAPYIQQSYQQYEEFRNDTPEYIIDRHLFNTLIYKEDIEEYFLSRIKHYASWKIAGLYIRPETGKYVDPMITCSPLYIADDYNKLLDPVKKLWNTEFQERLRYKLINESSDIRFKGMPENQLGLVVAMNYFNYRPLDAMREYFKEIYNLLCKGGIFIFTYNNCDLPGSVRNVEKAMYSYTPGKLVQAMCESIGFEILNVVDYEDTNVSWLEIKKPGEFKSMRGGQALAKIITQKADRI